MNRTLALVATLLVLVAPTFAVQSAAQGVQTATIRGTVVDQQNLPVENVTVTISSPTLQGTRATQTGADGSYVFRQLPAGVYEVTFETTRFTPAKRSTEVLLGLTVEQNVTLQAAGVAEEVQVVAETPAPIATPVVGANYKHDEIDALATRRTLQGIAELAPAVTQNTPNTGQLAINGAFAYDNIFMLNGVDINDNLFAQPQNLFIEDAIEETQILTSGIGAEYGRFTGGVVNAITKSGGNVFSGSYRVNFSNPSWTKQTPFELCDSAVTVATCAPAPPRLDDQQFVHEGTFGGPILRDQLWFFAAGRYTELSTAGTLPLSNLSNTQTDTNKRGEIKLTGTVSNNHTIQGGYLNNSLTNMSRPSFGFTIDPVAVSEQTRPNWYYFTNYRGVLSSHLLVEGQFSQRKWSVTYPDAGSTALVDSPVFSLNQLVGASPAQYNGRYWDFYTDPEGRNNYQITGNLTYFLSAANNQRHEIKGGYEWFRSQRTGGGSQSASGYVFDADFAEDTSGAPLTDANGRFIPVFVPGETIIEHWMPILNAELNVDNNSFFAQDHWVINNKLSADLGLRYERARSEATGNVVGVDTDTVVPRFAVAYDIQGDGNKVVHATYGHYAGRYNESQVGNNNNVGNPDRTLGLYSGPAGQGRGFAPGFAPANYMTVLGIFPTANTFFEDGLSSPTVKEFTTSYGTTLLNGRGYAEGSYIWRNTANVIEDYISLANGVTTVVGDGFEVGTFTNIVYDNAPGDEGFRDYQALVFQGRYNMQPRWTLNGHYTIQLENDGNFEGEAANQPAIPSRIGDYPEIFNAARHFPDGRLANFQRHKVRIWSIYTADMGRFGDASISGLIRVDSAVTYSLRSAGQPITSIQTALISAYPDAPESQTIYYDERGSESFAGYGVFDLGVGYNIPVFRSLRPWVKLDMYNLFNNQKLIAWNTTVTQDPNSPTDNLGLRTGYRPGGSFGKATSNTHFPTPFQGDTGGRTWRIAAGFRF